MTDYETLVERFRDRKVLVLGDMVADEYLVGRPERISREAPVLILQYRESFVRPGGATNTAYNLSALGARACVVGTIGDDEMGARLRTSLEGAGIATLGLTVVKDRPTSTATRVLASGQQEVQQQIVRIDRIERSPVEGPARDRMIDIARATIPQVDALLISDYENGVISQEVLDACLPVARANGSTVIVDSHGDLFRFKGVTAATPNQPEAEATLRATIGDTDDLEAAGQALLAGMDAEAVLITRGIEGIALFERGRDPYLLPAAMNRDREVVDPTGAGDTVAAVFTLALTSGAAMQDAAFLANIAGGAVVRKVGAATVSRDELCAAVRDRAGPAQRHAEDPSKSGSVSRRMG